MFWFSGVFFFVFFPPSSVNRQLSVSSSVSTRPPSISGATAPALVCSSLGLILADSGIVSTAGTLGGPTALS